MKDSSVLQFPFLSKRLAGGGVAVLLAIVASAAVWAAGANLNTAYAMAFCVAAASMFVLLVADAAAQSYHRPSQPENVLMLERPGLLDSGLQSVFISHGFNFNKQQYNPEWMEEFGKFSQKYDIIVIDANLPHLVFVELKTLALRQKMTTEIVAVALDAEPSPNCSWHIVEASSNFAKHRLSAVLQK